MCFITLKTSVIVSPILNILRQVASGCMFMPFVTWVSSNMKKEYTAHTIALLIALRTIAGAIGMSVFIGIMTPAANSNTSLSYVESSIKGLNISFLFMGIVSIILLSIAIFGLKKDVSDELYEVS